MLACMLAILHNKLVHIFWWNITIQKYINRDFPGGPAVKSSPSNAGGAGSILGPEDPLEEGLDACSLEENNDKPKQHIKKAETLLCLQKTI